MKFELPEAVQKAIEKLELCGFCGYLVGGCVRDYLLGKKPVDFDMTTDASPAEVKKCFKDYRVIETGITHGTVTVILEGFPLEITTHRIETGYSDKRHPDRVLFTKNIAEDLARRDFTMNAMAYHPSKGLIDLFGGEKDLSDQMIRCVGDPNRRFNEDALRILRGLRFASVLGFYLEERTKKALFENRELLKAISVERIAIELTKLLCGKNVRDVLINGVAVIGVMIPELLPMEEFNQKNPHHCYDVLTHTAVALENILPIPHLRWAMLFHDAGKPGTYTEDSRNIGHFRGHSQLSEKIAVSRLQALKMDNKTISQVRTLVKYHTTPLEPSKKSIKRWLNRLSKPLFLDLLAVKHADILAKSPGNVKRLETLEAVQVLLQEIISENECFSLKDLAVNGSDLIELGINNGEEIGRILKMLLEGVIDEEFGNTREILLEKAKELKNVN
ncbi:MAG: HD domain-containing protein [Eubacteriaceae bacterium]|nr:HD domain-containing protein [Eubacteriaceae bacterium]